MPKKISAFVARGLGLVLGFVFVYAAWHKIADPAGFAKIIYGYGLFPAGLINICAVWIPFLEFLAGACLILGVLPRGALAIINSLLAFFILIIGFNLLRGHEFDCGCFSLATDSSRGSAVQLLIRDVILLGLGLFLWHRQSKTD